MNYLIDTCVVSDLFKKIPSTIKHFERVSPNHIHISAVSIMEIEYGLRLNSEKEKKIRPIWDAFLKQVQTVPFSQKCAKETALIRASLKNLGQPVGPYDILIAGTAVAYDLIVVTSNLSELKRIPLLSIEDWRES